MNTNSSNESIHLSIFRRVLVSWHPFGFLPSTVQVRTFVVKWHGFLWVRCPFLSPNQECQEALMGNTNH